MEFDLESVLKILASIVGLLLGFAKLNEPKADLKKDLKLHLEIRESLTEGTEDYERVSREISELISIIYPTPEEAKVKQKAESMGNSLVLSLLTGLAFSIWSIWIVFTDFSWWFLLTAFIAFIAFHSLKETLDLDEKQKNETGDDEK
ncbi:hypothetical protein ACPV50_03065 [Vibrio astriarenae]